MIGTSVRALAYDAVGRLTQSVEDNGAGDDVTAAFAYDAGGRLTLEGQRIAAGNFFRTGYVYDEVNLATRITYQSGKNVDKTFTTTYRPATIVSSGTTYAQFEYDDRDAPTKTTFGNGNEAVIAYDSMARMTRKAFEDGSSNVRVGFEYGYNKVSQKLYEEALHDTDASSHVYRYDTLHRLTGFERGELIAKGLQPLVQQPNRAQDWLLDHLANWTRFTVNGTPEDRTVNAVNEYTSVGGTGYTYDANGNLTSDGTYSFEYDAFNRLVRVKQAATTVAEYLYDAANRRVKKAVGYEEYQYVYGGWQVLEEYYSVPAKEYFDNLYRRFTYGEYIDEPVVMECDKNLDGDFADTNETLYYSSNNTYSVSAMFNTSGDIVEHYKYDPYGKATIFTGKGADNVWFTADDVTSTYSAVDNPYTFTGRRLDTETGLMYFRNRYYSCSLGRFISRDALEYVDGWNLYRGYFAVNGMDCDGLTVVINIWEGSSGSQKAWGHASASINGGDGSNNDKDNSYVSFWPESSYGMGATVADAFGGSGVNAETSSYEVDKASEHDQDPDKIEIDGLDEDAMKKEWEKMKKEMANGTLKYEGAGSNCCTAVARVLWAGVDKTIPKCKCDQFVEVICFTSGPGEIPGVDCKDNLRKLAECLKRCNGKIYRCSKMHRPMP